MLNLNFNGHKGQINGRLWEIFKFKDKDNVMKVLNIMYNIWWTRKKNIFQHHNTSNTEAILYMNQIIKKCTKNSWNKGENKKKYYQHLSQSSQ